MKKVSTTIWLTFALSTLSLADAGWAQEMTETQDFTVTLLGTGTPIPNIERFGPSTLVEVGNQKLLFDSGRGATIRLAQLGIPVADVTAVFLTHFHSDHVNGLADMWLTGWIYPPDHRRTKPFEVYGPIGTLDMMTQLEVAHAADIRMRIADEKLPPSGIAINSHDVTEGVIYDHEGVRVTVFDVDHGELIKPSLGYRIDYHGYSVVLSGDTRLSTNLIKYAKDTDVLIHEVMTVPPDMLAQSEMVRRIMDHHSSPEDAGRVFSESGARLAVYNHIIFFGYKDTQTGLSELIRKTRTTYTGKLEVGSDLMSIEVSDMPRILRPGQTQ